MLTPSNNVLCTSWLVSLTLCQTGGLHVIIVHESMGRNTDDPVKMQVRFRKRLNHKDGHVKNQSFQNGAIVCHLYTKQAHYK